MEQYFRTRASVDDDPDLARTRRANDARLKSRFEHIFAKYGRDFDGVGDEIDLETGRIIVNNGHIARMQHEVDPGQGTSAQVLQVLGGSRQSDSIDITRGAESIVEDSAEDVEDDEEMVIAGTSEYSSSDNDDRDGSDALPKTWARTPDELSSDFYSIQDATPQKTQSISKISAQNSAAMRQADNDQAVALSHAPSPSKSLDTPPVDLPFLAESLRAMQVLPGQRGSVDPDVIQALGQSIANQLAKFMTGGSKNPRRESRDRRAVKDSRWEYPILPGDRVDRTPSPSLPESASAALFATSPDREASVWAPPQRRGRKPLKLQSQVRHSTALDDDHVSDENDGIDILQSDPPSHMTTTIGDEAEGILDIDCYNCGTTDSRVWRTGPGGRLCDSCGTYYRRYGLLKAIEEPSFTPAPRVGRGRPSAADRQLRRNQDTDIFAIPSTDAPNLTANYSANTARRVTGDGRNGRFTLEEEVSIIRHHEIDQLSWDHIGYLLSLRSAYSVHSHYQRFLKAPGCEARRRLLNPRVRAPSFEIDGGASEHDSSAVESGNSHSHDISGFIEREDELIVRLREDERMTWDQIATYFPDRTSQTLQTHYNEILVGNESLSPAPRSKDRALDDRHIQRTIDNDSLSAVPVQATHPLPDAERNIDADFVASENYSPGASDTHAMPPISLPFTPEEDALILNMREERAAPFKEMIGLFRDRTEEALVDRYIYLKGHSADTGLNHTTGTTGTLDTVNATTTGPGGGLKPFPIGSASKVDARTGASPPHMLSRQAAVSERYHHKRPATGAEGDRAHFLNTPSINARQASVPPRPSEVGPSAWAITQPASKGPLPFQPARKGLVPIHPKSASRELHDPFISTSTTSGGSTTPRVHDVYDTTGQTRTVPKPHPRSAKPPKRNNALGMANQHSAWQEPVADAIPRPQELSAPATRFTSEQDKFIKRAREKRRLSWAEIAETLPGDARHTASGIMHRYYDFLLGKRSTPKTLKSREARASGNGGMPCSEEENSQVSRYMQQGMFSSEMADKMPDRPSVVSKNLTHDLGSKVTHQHVASQQQHHSKPLLRRAIKNLTRRNSDVANMSMLAEHHVQRPPQSPLEHDPDDGPSDHSPAVSRSHELYSHSHPEVIINSGEFAEAASTHEHASTNDRAADGQPETYTDYLRVSEEAQGDMPSPFQEPRTANAVTSSGTKRRRQSGCLSRVGDVEVAESDSGTALVQDKSKEIHGDAIVTPSAKRGRGRPRKSGVFSGGAPNREVLPESEHAQAASSTEQVSPKLGLGPACAVVQKGLQSVTDSEHLAVGTGSAPNALDEDHKIAHNPTKNPGGFQDSQVFKFHTWEEILLAAFRSQPGTALRCNEIAAWVRKHSAHYRHTNEPWIHHLYNEVYRNPAFEKAHPHQRKSGYVLIESNLRSASRRPANSGTGNGNQVTPSIQSTSAEQIIDASANKDDVGSKIRSTLSEHLGHDAAAKDQVDCSVLQASAESLNDSIGNRECIDNDELAGDLPTPETPASRPTDISTTLVKVIDLSSDSPIKQEPACESRTHTSQHAHFSTKRPLDAQDGSSRAKHVRYSDPVLVRRMSALATPARSSANSGRLGLHGQSTIPIKFEPDFGEEVRASPASSVGATGRRVVLATEVARDDGAEQDELS